MSMENGLQQSAAILTPDVTGTRISVSSLWKVFGPFPERAMAPEYAGTSKADIQAELGCVVALQDVSFDVNLGETFVVMGLSGSGKSTLVRCLIRLIEPTAGEIRIDGEDILSYNDKQLTQFPPPQVRHGVPALRAAPASLHYRQRGVGLGGAGHEQA